jgi:Zn-dependent protease
VQLSFRIGKIPVRVQASFLIMTLLLSAGGLEGGDLRPALAWIVIVFFSVLAHELGHALMGKAFGLQPQIDLHGMGGTTSWANGRNVSHGKGILISLAGPMVGLIVGAAVFIGALIVGAPQSEIGKTIFSYVLFVNAGWSVFNLLPMLPLDGGNVMRGVLNASTKGKGERTARIVSLVVAVAVAAAALSQRWIWITMLGAMFAYQNFRSLQALKQVQNEDQLRPQIDAAYEALRREDGRQVLALVGPLLNMQTSDPMRAEVLHLAAYGLLLNSRPREADQLIAMLPPGFSPHPQYVEARARFS